MTDKQLQAIVKHGRNLQAIFRTSEADPVKLCKKLRRLENKAHAIGLQMCNGPEMSEEEKEERDNQIMESLIRLLPSGNVPVFINHDPRGYALKIQSEWVAAHPELPIHRDWGGYGILAPEIGKDGE